MKQRNCHKESREILQKITFYCLYMDNLFYYDIHFYSKNII